ncbi:MAG TPA: MMPL family transporter [Aeromicrobium sp.]|nr:MMPL family transporter [Aeromicrobium sp.]HKY58570.1 MMPL family transporter [Aeromicrobium sp.]
MTGLPSNRRRLALIGAIVGVVATVVGLSRVTIDAGVDSFVTANDPTLAATNTVAESFGGDPIIVLLESETPRTLLANANISAMLRLEGALAGLDNVATVYGPGTVLNQIAGQAQDFLAELVGMRDGLRKKAEQEARDAEAGPAGVKAAGQAAVDKFDARYLPLMSRGLPAGLPTLRNEKFVANVVYNAEGDPRPQWDFVVPDANSVAILIRPNPNLRQAEVETLVAEVNKVVADRDVKGADVTVSGVPAVVASLGERIQRDVVLLGALALAGVGAWFFLTPWTSRRRRLVPLVVSLAGTAITLAAAGWLGIPMSLGVVAFLPVLLGVGSDFMIYLLTAVSRRLVVVAALATSASFAALGATPITAVRQLGWTLAIGIAVTLVASLVAVRFLGTGDEAEAPPTPVRHTAAPRRRRVAVAIVVSLIAAVGWALLPQLRLDADFQTLARDLPAYDDARHVQEVMGSSGEVAVAVVGRDVASPEALAWMRKAEESIIVNHGDEMRPILSLPTLLRFLGNKPTDEELAASLRLLPSYLTSSVVRNDHRMAVLSYGVALDDATRLKALRDDILASLPPPPPGIKVELVGLPMVAVSAYESLAGDRYLNAGSGIVVAGLVLLLLLRRRRDAGYAVAAATVTTGLVLLGMAVLDIGLNPLTAAVGSLAAAVACEFTVVLMDARRHRGGRRHRTVPLAAAASATGYGVLAVSGVTSVRDFGLLLAVTVAVAALVAHLVVWIGAVGSTKEEASV